MRSLATGVGCFITDRSERVIPPAATRLKSQRFRTQVTANAQRRNARSAEQVPIQLGASQPADIECLFPSWAQSLIRELGPETRAIVYLGGETILKAGQRGGPRLVLAGVLRLYIESNEGRQASV